MAQTYMPYHHSALYILHHTNNTTHNHMPFMHAAHTLQPPHNTAHKIRKHTPHPTYDTQSCTHCEWFPSQSVTEGWVCNEVMVTQTDRHLFYYWAVTEYFSFRFVVYWFLVTSALHWSKGDFIGHIQLTVLKLNWLYTLIFLSKNHVLFNRHVCILYRSLPACLFLFFLLLFHFHIFLLLPLLPLLFLLLFYSTPLSIYTSPWLPPMPPHRESLPRRIFYITSCSGI